MLKAKEIQDQSVEELTALAWDLEKEIYQLKNELKMARKLEKPHLLKEKRRDRARILTILSQKQQSAG